jgi:putative RNA 2'-phosphotransferase
MSGDSEQTRMSRKLAHALRHRPDAYGLVLEPGGWAAAAAVCAALALEDAQLRALVDAPGRARFERDGDRIRARHGHSVAIALDHPVAVPPELLFHGTVARKLASIRVEGLRALARHHVHLTSSRDEASAIGARRGAPIVIEVRARALHDRGARFFQVVGSTIWLVDQVPADILVLPRRRPVS